MTTPQVRTRARTDKITIRLPRTGATAITGAEFRGQRARPWPWGAPLEILAPSWPDSQRAGDGDGLTIAVQDAFGVALVAIKAVSEQAADLQRQLHEVRRDVETGYPPRGGIDGR